MVLDPFGGAFTTALVAQEHGRDFAIIELNRSYVVMGIDRLAAARADAAPASGSSGGEERAVPRIGTQPASLLPVGGAL